MAGFLDFDGMPMWWSMFLSSGVVLVIVMLILLPPAMAGFFWSDQKQIKGSDGKYAKKGALKEPYDAKAELSKVAPIESLDKELWCPRLEHKEWTEASQMMGCPWNFEGCEDVNAALDRIWRTPLSKELQEAYDALKPRVKNLRVAKVEIPAESQVFFAIVYQLNTGAELFGGAPIEHAVGLEMAGSEDDDNDDSSTGLRRRRGAPSSPKKKIQTQESSLLLPCLAPFYRIHDGFGVLMSTKHLPLLMTHPSDSAHGSCFYVYPARGLEQIKRSPHLVKFARVDKNACACADSRLEKPCITYVEKVGETVDDEESPMSFVADTVSNVAGQRVVPPAYLGGPGGQFSQAGPA